MPTELTGIRNALRFLIEREMEREIRDITRFWLWNEEKYNKKIDEIRKKYQPILDGLKEEK